MKSSRVNSELKPFSACKRNNWGRVSNGGGEEVGKLAEQKGKKNDNAPINFTITCAMHITSSEALH